MNKKELMNKKIAIVGVGGVGGYLAGMMLRTLPQVTLCARGERGRSIAKNGLVLHSEYHGESRGYPKKIVASSRELEPQDYVFICVKNYSLKQACEELADAITDETVIIPVMNGADPAENTRKYLGKGTVLDSVIYIVSFANPDYSITQQGMFDDVKIGMENPSPLQREKIRQAHDLLTLGGIDCQIAEDIQAAIWRKYIFNCAYNVLTAYYDEPIGPIRQNKKKAGEFRALINEAYAVCKAKNIHVTDVDIAFLRYRFQCLLADGATSSLQRDYENGKPTELETFSGYLVREAQRLGIPAPVSERMYEGLSSAERAR